MATERTNGTSVSLCVYGSAELHHPQRTYVVVGNGRGGTSMVAGVVAALGVSLNPSGRLGITFEDNEIVNAALGRDVAAQQLSTTREEDIATVRKLIEARNAGNDVWGWKDPSADLYIKDIVADLRNPHFILVWRDLAAVATRNLALQPQLSPLDALQTPLARLNRYWTLLAELNRPTLMVSYERGRMEPLVLAKELAAFLGAPVDDRAMATIERFVSPAGGYRELDSPEGGGSW